ncbi:MAG: glycosyltransferase [candidate division KSB1 bacterium]|nr:glycosyltransferase [candidate division KSB1 bacterium]
MGRMPARKKLLFVVDGFGIGGAEFGALRLIRALRRTGAVSIDVCSTRRDDRLYPEFARAADQVFWFPRRSRLALTSFLRLLVLIRTRRYDVVQTALFYADALGVPAAKLCGVPCIISWQTALGLRTGYAKDDLLRHILTLRLVSRLCSRMVAVSDDLRRSFVARGLTPEDKIQTIHYGVDVEEYRPDTLLRAQARRKLGLTEGQIAIGAMGHFNPVKNHRVLVEAFAEIARDESSCVLLLAGDGQERPRLEAMVQHFRLGGRVRFVGYYRPAAEFLNALDVYVHPSLQEGLPNAVIEAMATGLPVIGAIAGGIPEIVVDGVTGFLFDPRHSGQLAERLATLCASPELRRRMSLAGRKRAVDHFSLEVEARKFLALYEDVLDHRPLWGSKGSGS